MYTQTAGRPVAEWILQESILSFCELWDAAPAIRPAALSPFSVGLCYNEVVLGPTIELRKKKEFSSPI